MYFLKEYKNGVNVFFDLGDGQTQNHFIIYLKSSWKIYYYMYYEPNQILFISKPILHEKFFMNWKDKKEYERLTYDRKNIIKARMSPLFLYEFIKIQKTTNSTTRSLLYILV